MEIRTSVRKLVEFILRSGDIDNRKTVSAPDAMQEGGRIHRMIQRSMGPNYYSEVSLRHVIPTSKYNIVIDGRADGIVFTTDTPTVDAVGRLEDSSITKAMRSLRNKDEDFSAYSLLELSGAELKALSEYLTVTIDEIKGTYRDVNRMKKAEDIHLAQAKCYAYIYALQNELDNIRVRITYCNMETEQIRYFHFDYTFEELDEWFGELISEYRKWTDFEFEWKKKRQASIKKLEFPFEYRKGQKNLVTYVYQTIYHKRKLFIEAPTGVGKTISTVFPSIKAMGENLSEKIFYLTAKTITRTVAEQTLSTLREQDLFFKTVTLTAKDKICFLDEAECNPVACTFAKGHFDRINEALFDILTNVDNLSRDEILKYSIKYQVCPFELSLDISLFADMVICDYNYLFDPHAYLRRFFTEGVREDYTFLIDEAHNLVERGRDMYSATLIKEDFLRLKNIVKEHDEKIARALEACNKEMLLLKRESEGEYRILEEMDYAPFMRRVLRLSSLMEDYLEEHEDGPVRKQILLFYFEISHFLLMYENLDENYVTFTDFTQDNSFFIKLFNVNPSKNLRECMMRGRSTILFSATMLPIDYHKNLLGYSEGDYEVYAESVFDNEKRGLYLANDVTSKYTRRNIAEYESISEYIFRVVNAREGNYMVFFPSFAFLNMVSLIYAEKYPEHRLLIQNSSMKEDEREEFMSQFNEEHEGSLIGMCVMGGIFAEGIDLKEDRLIGALIVGTGLPMVCNEREILKKHFSKAGFNGYDYAYKYPGMNKVLQAAGRVVRTEKDIGVVALLDERFLETGYLRMFPREWSNYEIVSKDIISKRVETFWNSWL